MTTEIHLYVRQQEPGELDVDVKGGGGGGGEGK